MNELVNQLEKVLSNMKEMTDVLKRSRENHMDVATARFHKGVEDGILNSMDQANEKQYKMITEAYKFKYYTEFNNDRELLKREVLRIIRDKKLKLICG